VIRLGMLALAVLLASAANLNAQARDGVFSAKVEAVRVDVLVTHGDTPVLGLGPGDFDLLDNGVPQQVDLVSFEQIPLNVILALDMSESVAGDKLTRLQRAIASLLQGLEKDDQAALVTFSQQVVLGAPLSADMAPIQHALEGAGGSGDTALIDGTYAGIMVGEGDVGRGLLIVFSDGVDTASWLTADSVLDTAKRSDIVVYVVSVRSKGKPEFLAELASLTGGRLHEIEKTANLSAVFLSVLQEFRVRYLVSYTPRGVDASGFHRLEVRIKGRRATVRARPGYLAGP
jgi:Ca-activated chloride channel homolog